MQWQSRTDKIPITNKSFFLNHSLNKEKKKIACKKCGLIFTTLNELCRHIMNDCEKHGELKMLYEEVISRIDANTFLNPNSNFFCWLHIKLWLFLSLKINSYTKNNMKFTMLEQVKSPDPLYRSEREKLIIRKFNTFYNGIHKEPWWLQYWLTSVITL